jgi:hypothetical protein
MIRNRHVTTPDSPVDKSHEVTYRMDILEHPSLKCSSYIHFRSVLFTLDDIL